MSEVGTGIGFSVSILCGNYYGNIEVSSLVESPELSVVTEIGLSYGSVDGNYVVKFEVTSLI